MGKKKQAIAYCRTNADSGSKIDAKFKIKIQKNNIQIGARRADVAIKKWFISLSPSDTALAEILEYCRQHPQIEYLAVSSPDRISRSLTDFGEWMFALGKLGVKIVVLPDLLDTPESLFRMQIMVAMAEFASRHRSESIKRGLRRKKENGDSTSVK